MKKYQALIIALLIALLSTPACYSAVTISYVAGTSAGWDFHELDGDIARSNIVDPNDLNVIAQNWLAGGCTGTNQWCNKADIDASTSVDLIDYAILAKDWGKQAGQGILLQTIYGTAQDANGTITANTAHSMSMNKGCAFAFQIASNTALDKAIFKLTGLRPSEGMKVRLFNVTGKGYLTYGHTMSKGDPGSGSTAIFDITATSPNPVIYHTEGALNCTDLIINFGSMEVTAGEYLMVFDNMGPDYTSCGLVRGAVPAIMETYPDGTPLPKRATVTTSSTTTGSTYFYYLSATSSTSYKPLSYQIALQITIANRPPTVNAGPDQSIQAPVVANLSGTASDDGLPDPPGALTTTWSQVSGPNMVRFGYIHALNTTATFSDLGTYILRLTANDGALSTSDDITILYTNNSPPAVDAGLDQTVGIVDLTRLAGTVTDDGLPNPPGVVTTQWTQISGPGTATFGDASDANSIVTFDANGTYVLRLAANDSQFSSYDEVTYTVVPGSLNNAPVVEAGTDQTVILPLTIARLNGMATDDGKPNPPGHLTIIWSQQSGPGTVTFADPHSVTTTATASAFGIYLLRLTADDGALQVHDEVTVTWKSYAYEGYEPVPTGGEGGEVVHVTNLNASGAGSFAAAVSGSNRIVVFDVSGPICISSEIRIGQSNITIDGYSAPGAGITLVADDAAATGGFAPLGFKDANNIVIRNIRIRHTLPTGDLSGGGSQNSNKCIMIWSGTRIAIDHCSLTGAGDSSIACSDAGVDHIIVSYCLFAGSCEAFRSHGSYNSMHHCMFTWCNRRQPRIYGAGPYWDFRNCVVDHWTNTGTNILADDAVNVINNWYGDPAPMEDCAAGFLAGSISTSTNVYINGNYSHCGQDIDSSTQLSAPNLEPNVTTTDANTAHADVLAGVGAWPRDAIDQYYLNGGGINPPPTQ